MRRSGISGLGRLIRDYVESRDGRINPFHHLYLFLESAGRKKRKLRWDKKPWEDRTDAATGKVFSLFSGRGAQCFHPDKWKGLFPYWSHEGRRAYFIVPQKDCQECEFHEPKTYRKKYAACRWYRENSNLETPAQLFVKSVEKAKDMLGGAA